MGYIADRVQVTTATTGTGAVTLGAAVSGYQSFATAFADKMPCVVAYLIVSGTAWEVGRGTLNSVGDTLTRDNIRTSSNAGALITLSGTSNVFCTASAEFLDNSKIGLQYALNRGFAMP
jgi:hypothetical protein